MKLYKFTVYYIGLFYFFTPLTTITIIHERVAYWQNKGVVFDCPDYVVIDDDVVIGEETHIGFGAHLLNGTIIGKNCQIKACSYLDNAILGDEVTVHPYTIVANSHLKSNTEVGPFAHIHKNSVIEHGAIIGNFVEVSRSTVGSKSKSKHHAYLGMTKLGKKVNVGAGTITCNYDGKNKHETIIEDGAFIGSNNTLVAPVVIGKRAFTAAGSTITKDVPGCALAIARSRQINKKGYRDSLQSP